MTFIHVLEIIYIHSEHRSALGVRSLSSGHSWFRRMLVSCDGVSLVEVLVAVALLSAVAVPMLDFTASIRGAAPFQRQIAINLASSKIEELGHEAYRTTFWPKSDSKVVDVGQFSFTLGWTISAYTPATANDYPAEQSQLRKATMTVSCNNCPRPFPPVKVVAVLEKL
ncbi:MAG: hypothetical protein JWN15_2789 [Firmicutes bacterium]|nr:hypothetical protein [Bacillota bacterium]